MAAETRKSRQLASNNVSNVIAGNAVNSEDGQVLETPRDFLHSCGANKLLLDAMAGLLQTRPKDPIAFLSDHFGSLIEAKSSFQNAHEKIRSIHYTKDIFESILIDAYQGFKEKRGKNIQVGLQGTEHNELMMKLLNETPVIYSEQLLKRLMKPEKQSISFSIFRSSVLIILVFEDLIKTAKSVYMDIDFANRGRADRQLCTAILSEFTSMFLEPTYQVIDMPQLQSIMLKNENKDEFASNKSTMNIEEFVKTAVNSFIKGLV